MFSSEIRWYLHYFTIVLTIFGGTAVCGLLAVGLAPETIMNDKGQMIPWPYHSAVPLTPHQMYWLGFGYAFGSLFLCLWLCGLMMSVMKSAVKNQADQLTLRATVNDSRCPNTKLGDSKTVKTVKAE